MARNWAAGVLALLRCRSPFFLAAIGAAKHSSKTTRIGPGDPTAGRFCRADQISAINASTSTEQSTGKPGIEWILTIKIALAIANMQPTPSRARVNHISCRSHCVQTNPTNGASSGSMTYSYRGLSFPPRTQIKMLQEVSPV